MNRLFLSGGNESVETILGEMETKNRLWEEMENLCSDDGETDGS